MRKLSGQRLGLAVGAALGVVGTLAAIAALVLVGSRDSKRDVPARPAPGGGAGRTLHPGDVVRAPLSSTRCAVSQEGGQPNLFCSRTPAGKFQVVFYDDSVLVFRVGDPDNPTVYDWKP